MTPEELEVEELLRGTLASHADQVGFDAERWTAIATGAAATGASAGTGTGGASAGTSAGSGLGSTAALAATGLGLVGLAATAVVVVARFLTVLADVVWAAIGWLWAKTHDLLPSPAGPGAAPQGDR